ncbi:MAG: nucleoside-diphosphate sugar epimerase [Methylibium sp. NZG]|nr:MAG: nucleoside-diphosphate sugar epimerase [Methylibium sp. NZG]
MNRILVTGASGHIGTELVNLLKARGADFAVMSSRPGSAAAGVLGIPGDFADPASLQRAFSGFDTLFLLLPLVPNKLELARNAVQAAKAAGVRHIVRSSGAGADAASPVSLARLQGSIDQLVVESGIAHTFLRPATFMQNLVNFSAAQIKGGTLYAPHGDGAQSLVDVRDIAECAAVVLADPAAHAGQAYTLTGGEAFSNAQQMALVSRAIGRPVAYVDVPEAAAVEAMQGMGVPAPLIGWFMSLNHVVKQGWAAGISGDVAALTGHPPRRLEAFIAENVAAWRA